MQLHQVAKALQAYNINPMSLHVCKIDGGSLDPSPNINLNIQSQNPENGFDSLMVDIYGTIYSNNRENFEEYSSMAINVVYPIQPLIEQLKSGQEITLEQITLPLQSAIIEQAYTLNFLSSETIEAYRATGGKAIITDQEEAYQDAPTFIHSIHKKVHETVSAVIADLYKSLAATTG